MNSINNMYNDLLKKNYNIFQWSHIIDIFKKNKINIRSTSYGSKEWTIAIKYNLEFYRIINKVYNNYFLVEHEFESIVDEPFLGNYVKFHNVILLYKRFNIVILEEEMEKYCYELI